MEYFQSAEFDAKVKDLMGKKRVPGLSVAVLQDDKTDFKAFGVSSVASGAPCTVDSLFDIASASKIATAASVALLVEDNTKHASVAWDTPVSKILPDDFVLSDPEYTKSVTVEDMLSHRTGLAGHELSYFGANSEHTDNARSVTRNLRNLQVCAPLRTKYVYSNLMYTAATHLVETQTGLSFGDFLETRLFAPLSMASSSLQPSRSRKRGFGARIAAGHVWKAAEDRYREIAVMECPEAQGAGSIVTSAGDYLKLMKAFLTHEAPITKQVYDGLTTIRSLPNPTSADVGALSSPRFYCAGLAIEYYRGHAIMAHNGGVPGFGSRFLFIPSLHFSAVVLGNAIEAAYVAMDLQKLLVDSILGSAQDTPEPKPANDGDGAAAAPSESDAKKAEEGEPQKMPLTAYTGLYWNPGYRGLRVQIQDDQLLVDARDRGVQATITLRHQSGQTKYLAEMETSDALGGFEFMDEPVPAEFVFENDKAVKFGLLMDLNLGLIWFDRVHDEAKPYQ